MKIALKIKLVNLNPILMKFKVLITASGLGSRLGNLTRNSNKALVRVGDYAVITHIIENYSNDTHFVITLGHFGSLVKQYIEICHPDLNVSFIQVDNYKGEGSSLLYSILKAKSLLKEPFVFHVSDAITDVKFSNLTSNYIAGFEKGDTSIYSSYNIDGKNVTSMFKKGEINPDFIHIGVVFIFNHKEFWETATEIYNDNKELSSLNDVSVINKMIQDGIEFKHQKTKNWFDIGSVKGLINARKSFIPKILKDVLDKEDENIYYYNNYIVKFFSNEKITQNRIKRASLISYVVPSIKLSSKNFYSYKLEKGNLYSKSANISNFEKFLNFFDEKLWIDKIYNDSELELLCKEFYIEKTSKRISDFLSKYKLNDEENVINGIKVPKVSELLKLIPESFFSDNIKTKIHGDFILDNCIYQDNKFKMIDWRQDFSGELEFGDLYYDLSKLAHNIVVNHEIIEKDLYSYNNKNNNIDVDILCKKRLIDCEKILFSWAKEKAFSLKKIEILRALIWINMSPLHHQPFDSFLFYFGKYNLLKSLNEKN